MVVNAHLHSTLCLTDFQQPAVEAGLDRPGIKPAPALAAVAVSALVVARLAARLFACGLCLSWPQQSSAAAVQSPAQAQAATTTATAAGAHHTSWHPACPVRLRHPVAMATVGMLVQLEELHTCGSKGLGQHASSPSANDNAWASLQRAAAQLASRWPAGVVVKCPRPNSPTALPLKPPLTTVDRAASAGKFQTNRPNGRVIQISTPSVVPRRACPGVIMSYFPRVCLCSEQ